jgi:PAS domain S-box-containing protein
VNESKKNEFRLEWYRHFVETAHEGIWVIDAQANTTFVNPRMAEMLGYLVDEILGLPIFNFMDPTGGNKAKQIFTIRSREGFAGQIDYWFPRKDGSVLWAIVNTRPIFNENREFSGVLSMVSDITDRKLAEKALRKAHEDLEVRVQERTRELQDAVNRLEGEITERRRVETELENKAEKLEELNTALKVLLEMREQDKETLERKVEANLKELVMPYVEKLKEGRLRETQKVYLDCIEKNIEDILSPFTIKISDNLEKLTPTELQVANLVRKGKSTKEIASIMIVSEKTIETHRKHIRAKLGLKSRKVNLQTHLMSLST